MIEAEKYNASLDAWRETGIEPNAIKEGTIKWLTEKYQKSLWYMKLAPKTQKGYNHWIKKINDFAGNKMLTSMTRMVCKGYYTKTSERSLHNGNAALRFLRVLFSYAIDEGITNDNPAKGIRLIGTKSRTEVWTHDETDLYVQKAVAEKRRSIALAVIIAESIGQREGDILKLAWDQYDGKSIKIRQGKTGSYIDVKCLEKLREWLDNTERTSNFIIVSETTQLPYKEDNFQQIFADIKRDTPLSTKWFMDLRRTAVVRLAEAGCEIPEIASITGHSIETSQKILEVYLPRNALMASNAIDKLERHQKKKLEAAVGSDK